MTTSRDKRYSQYDEFYLRGKKSDAIEFHRQIKNYSRKFDDLLDSYSSGSVLDVGCATGMFCAYLKTKGFDTVVGIDLNEALIKEARDHVDTEFIHGDAQEFMEKSGRLFDIIFLINVVEHIERDHVVNFMKAVHSSLKSDGFAVVRVPNMNNILSAGHLADDLTHFTGLTEQSLKQLSLSAGFREVIELNQFSMQNFKGKIKAMIGWGIHKFLFWLRSGSRPKIFYRNLYAKIVK